MKSEFKAKLLQHVLAKKDSEKGFTLIELLVVIIIIGILAAIALPSFLNQSNKAKQGEAKTYVSSANKGQQAYYTEKGTFVIAQTNYNNLGLGVPTTTTNYVYNITGNVDTAVTTNNRAITKANPLNVALRGYAGRVNLAQITATSEVSSYSVNCEVKLPGSAVAIADPSFTSPDQLICDPTTQENVGK
jgi:type IV pilus assembly protein PilA